MTEPSSADPGRRQASARALFLHCLRFDVWEAGPDRSSSRWFGAALGVSLLQSLLAMQMAERGTVEALAVLFTAAAVLALFGVLSEVALTLLSPRDLAFLRTVPVSSAAYFRARCSALFVGLGLRALSYGLAASLVLTVAGWPWWTPLPFLLGLFVMFCCEAVLAIVFVFALQRIVPIAAWRTALVYLQVAVSVAAAGGLLWSFQGAMLPVDWFTSLATPPAWFAHLTALGVGAGSAPAAALAVCALVASAIVGWRIGQQYERVLDRAEFDGAGTGRAAGSRLGPFERWFVDSHERAGYHLARALLRRERVFRLQTYPLLAYPILFLAFGSGRDDGGLFILLFSHLCTVYLPLVAIFQRFSDAAQAAWVFRVHSLHGPPLLWSGARKALVRAVVVPVAVVVMALLIWDRGIRFGLIHGAIAGSVATVVVLAAPRPRRCWPFGESYRGGLPKAEEISAVYPLLAGVVVLALLQFGLERRAPEFLPVLALGTMVLAAWRLRTPGRSSAERFDAGAAAAENGPSAPQVGLPFAERLRAEGRALGVLYAGLAVFGAFLGWAS